MVSAIERFHCIQDSQLGPNGVLYKEVPLWHGLVMLVLMEEDDLRLSPLAIVALEPLSNRQHHCATVVRQRVGSGYETLASLLNVVEAHATAYIRGY